MWTSANTLLKNGELALDNTNGRLKVGDGSTLWNSLAYMTTKTLSTSGAPSSGTGVDGDFAIDSTAKIMYGPKAGGAWPGGVSYAGTNGTNGTNGWSPTLAVVSNGGTGYVLQIVGWVGGTGSPPSSTNQFIGPSGIVGTAAAGQDIRGLQGVAGTGVPAGGTTSQFLLKNSATNYDTLWGPIPNGSLSLAMQAAAPANSVRGEFTGSAVAPQDLTLAANTFVARGSSGNVAAKAISDAGLSFAAAATVAAQTAALNAATTALQGMMSASDKTKLNGLWKDIVADFGADPTGAVDATTIIQGAYNSFGSTGGVLYFPPGTYKVSANITISKPVITMGAGRSISVINMVTATGDMFTMVSGSQGAGFEQMRLSANTAGLRTAGYAMDFGAQPNVYMQQCDILFQWAGVKSSGALQFLDDVNIREIGANAANGNSVLVNSTGDRYLRRLTMDQAARTVDFAGIRINQCSSCVIADSNIIHCGTALDITANAGIGTAVASVYAVNTFFDTSVIGSTITCATGTDTVQRVTFVRSWFSTHTTAGVVLGHANVNSVDFIGCEFYQEPHGIRADACTEWAVRSSRFAGCTTNAIRTTAGATHSFTIADNFIGNGAGFGANAQGINIQAGAYNRYQVLDNRGLDTNTTPGIIDLGTTTYPQDKNISNNMGGPLAIGPLTKIVTAFTTAGTTEQVVFSARVRANTLVAGSVFRVFIAGQSSSTGTVAARIRLGVNGTTADNGAILVTSAAQVANQWGSVEGYVTMVTLGASGSASGYAKFTGGAAVASPAASAYGALAGSAVVNTTTDVFVTLTLTVSIGTFTVRNGYIEVEAP